MRLALLTGGSRGLGLALCETLVANGFKVIEFSRTAPHPYSVRADLSSPEEARRAVVGAIAPINADGLKELLVVNNAATLDPIGPAHRKAATSIVANLNTNFTSAIVILSEIVAHFQGTACRKVLANISAGAAQKGIFGWSLYCAAKVGAENFIRSLALEQQIEPFPFIPVNIDPGVVDTEMHVRVSATSLSDFPARDRFIQRKAQGQLASPTVVAATVLRILELSSLSSGQRYDVRDVGA
jgi:benzil reductase ((S)-benzoin forming)